MRKPTTFHRMLKIFQLNQQQLDFGSYAAELSFYIIWAVVPLMLALTNVFSILPYSEEEILRTIQLILPSQVENAILDLLKNDLNQASTGFFSVSLIISLWPASNVFNTIQRLLNKIYKTKPRKNFLVARFSAYVFTLVTVIATVIFAFILVFGESILTYLSRWIPSEIQFMTVILNQAWLIGIVILFIFLLGIYYFIPNVQWSIRYAIPGSLFTTIGFLVVFQIFPIYLSFTSSSIGQGAVGVMVLVIIWLYLNSFVFAIGAYINVFYHDFHCKSYWQLLEETSTFQSFKSYSPGFQAENVSQSNFSYIIKKVSEGEDVENDIN